MNRTVERILSQSSLQAYWEVQLDSCVFFDFLDVAHYNGQRDIKHYNMHSRVTDESEE